MIYFDIENISHPFVMIGDTMLGDFDDFDVPFDGDDFDPQDLVGRIPSKVQPGQWMTREGKIMNISDMERSHIINSMNMLVRVNGEDAADSHPKYLEFVEELSRRNNQNVITVKREFTITRGMLIKLLQDQGIKINDCGFYINCHSSCGENINISEIKARWDCDEPIKPKVNHANKNRNRGTVNKAVPRRKSTKRG